MDKPLNHDSPWKDTIDQFTRSFLEVTFPDCGEPGCFVGPGSRWFVGIGCVEAGWSVGWEAC
jgi:hypothetical protein